MRVRDLSRRSFRILLFIFLFIFVPGRMEANRSRAVNLASFTRRGVTRPHRAEPDVRIIRLHLTGSTHGGRDSRRSFALAQRRRVESPNTTVKGCVLEQDEIGVAKTVRPWEIRFKTLSPMSQLGVRLRGGRRSQALARTQDTACFRLERQNSTS